MLKAFEWMAQPKFSSGSRELAGDRLTKIGDSIQNDFCKLDWFNQSRLTSKLHRSPAAADYHDYI